MSEQLADQIEMYVRPDSDSSDIDVCEYAGLVKRIAQHMLARMPSSVQLDDLIQSGMVGLLEAAQKYDASKGASFETYAGIRIRGAIVDEMRRGDWAPRSVHKNGRQIAEAIAEIEHRTGRDARDTEIADALDIPVEEYHRMAKDCASTRLFSLDEVEQDDEHSRGVQVEDNEEQGPAQRVSAAQMRQALISEISRLPEREKLVLSLYYDQELNLKEIGQVLGVSESRVSQLHSQAAVRLRAKLGAWNP